MTARKPRGDSFESWVDKQVREATERGEFDNLPGAGKPLPDRGERYNEMWWVNDYVRRQNVSRDALLPPPLALRKEVERLAETVRELPSEDAVREVAEDLNRRIAANISAPSQLRLVVRPVDVDRLVADWRAQRPAKPADAAPTPAEQPRSSWWRRMMGK